MRTVKSGESLSLPYYLPTPEKTSQALLESKVQSSNGFYSKDPDTATVIPSELTEVNYKDLTESTAGYNFAHIPQSQHINSSDNLQTSLESVNFWSVGTNTDQASFVNQASQTINKATKEASIQTDLYMSSFPNSLFKSNLSMKPWFVCCFCQRHYSTKSTYERHLRVHIKTNNRQIRAKVVLSSESNNQNFNAQNETPIIIQLPSSTKIKCDQCKKNFSSKIEKDEHKKSCIIEPFPMTKCRYCDVKCYTSGLMDEHVKNVHSKNKSPRKNFYYCVFCDESFRTCNSFHLHLDQHLSP